MTYSRILEPRHKVICQFCEKKIDDEYYQIQFRKGEKYWISCPKCNINRPTFSQIDKIKYTGNIKRRCIEPNHKIIVRLFNNNTSDNEILTFLDNINDEY